MIGQGRLHLSETYFQESHNAETQSQSEGALSQLEADGIYETLLECSIPELVLSLVQHIDFYNYKQNGSSTNKYCAHQICDVSSSDLQNALKVVAAIV